MKEAAGLPPRPPTSIGTCRKLQYPPATGASSSFDTIPVSESLALPPAPGASLQSVPVNQKSMPESGLNCRMDHLNREEDKRVRRMLASRQSAMRARLKKAQYKDNLEHNVSSLQAEIAALTPQVAEYNKLLMVLNLENDALKQQLETATQETEFKEAQYEFRKQEKERLLHLLRLQSQQQQQLTPAEGELAMQAQYLNVRAQSQGSFHF